MGVPTFYKWLFDTFGSDLMYRVEDGIQDKENAREYNEFKHHFRFTHLKVFEDNHPKLDTSKHHFDNLYIDMNGIIHPCCHPETGTKPKDETEMLYRLLKYVDRIVRVMNPRSLLYLSVDGVAPRAKLNQQRSRRFTAGMEHDMKHQVEQKQLQMWEERIKQAKLKPGESSAADFINLYDIFQSEKSWDHNVITPGTAFMEKVNCALHYYAVYKANTDLKHLRIVVDDASIPGEGEHKIVNFIRKLRQDPYYNPNTVHVIHGLDADLVMLSLLLHEPNFWILREDVFDPNTTTLSHPIYLFDLDKLRRCIFSLFNNLLNSKKIGIDKVDWDRERLLDDFVFLCIFIGNDFVPHIPGLSVKHNGLPFLICAYVNLYLVKWVEEHKDAASSDKVKVDDSAYFTHFGELNLDNVLKFFRRIANEVDEYWMKQIGETFYNHRAKLRQEKRDRAKNAEKDVNSTEKDEGDNIEKDKDIEKDEESSVKNIESNEETDIKEFITQEHTDKSTINEPKIVFSWAKLRKRIFFSEALWILENKEEAQIKKLRNFYDAQLEVNVTKYSSTTISNFVFPLDVFKQENPNWRNLYYSIKFNIPCEEAPKLRENLANDYIQALAWIWTYYTTGIKSWSWYYPHHHAPLLSEFCEETLQISLKPFSLGAPLKPFVQLMAVMPKTSLHCVPDFLREMACKEDSPLAQLYPMKFHRDADCSDANWKAVPLIPFMDIARLEKIVKPVIAESKNNGKLTDEEKKRNSFGHAIMYFHSGNKRLLDHYKAVKKNGSVSKRSFKLSLDSSHMIRLDSNEAATVTAYLYAISKKHILGSILPKVGKPYDGLEELVPNYFKKIEKNAVLSVVFYSPVFEVKHFYLLPGIDKSKAHDFSQFEERKFRLSQDKLGRTVAILHTKDCQQRNSENMTAYGDGYGASSRSQKYEKVITAPINKRSLSENDYAKRNRQEQTSGNYPANGNRRRQAPENNNAKGNRWGKPSANYPAKRARVEKEVPNKRKRFN